MLGLGDAELSVRRRYRHSVASKSRPNHLERSSEAQDFLLCGDQYMIPTNPDPDS